MAPVRVGLVGAGYIGQRHLHHLSHHPKAEVAGVYDIDSPRLQALHQEGYKVFSSYGELLTACEAVFIASPTSTHYGYAVEALRQGKHVFIEKPVVTSPHELEDILRVADEAGTVTMVGHIERFNPAFQAILPWASEVSMVHFERLAPFTVRGSDVSVVLDLLIHDLDLIWTLWRRIPSHFHGTGCVSITNELDTVQVWLSFPGGNSASFLVSRHSPYRARRATFVGSRYIFEADLLRREARGWMLEAEPNSIELALPSYADAMYEEVTQFLEAIERGAPSPISVEDVEPVMEWAWHLERLVWRALGVSPSERLQ